MRIRSAVFMLVGAAAFVLAHASVGAIQQAEGGKTTWDGVYSQAQASKGEGLYNEKCAKCHGPDGSGGDAPSLVGSEFAADWDGLTIAQLFDRTRTSMPQDNPQSLTREEVASLLAFIFQKNGFPAGTNDLSDRSEMLGMIKYQANKAQ
jgi:S-disulfanyl-L-cysteine oxidoreductase SoxD